MSDAGDMERLLKSYGKKRQEDAQPPAEIHPATRRLLQGEVARVYNRSSQTAPGAATSASKFSWAGTWPRFGLALSLFVALAVVGYVGFWRNSMTSETELAKASTAAPATDSEVNGQAPSSIRPSPTPSADSLTQPELRSADRKNLTDEAAGPTPPPVARSEYFSDPLRRSRSVSIVDPQLADARRETNIKPGGPAPPAMAPPPAHLQDSPALPAVRSFEFTEAAAVQFEKLKTDKSSHSLAYSRAPAIAAEKMNSSVYEDRAPAAQSGPDYEKAVTLLSTAVYPKAIGGAEPLAVPTQPLGTVGVSYAMPEPLALAAANAESFRTPGAAGASAPVPGLAPAERKGATDGLVVLQQSAPTVDTSLNPVPSAPAAAAIDGVLKQELQTASTDNYVVSFTNSAAVPEEKKDRARSIVARNGTVLDSFRLAREGENIEITDADGSIYKGRLMDDQESAVAEVRAVPLQPETRARRDVLDKKNAAQMGRYFRALGTNRTLGQLIVVDGRLGETPAAEPAPVAEKALTAGAESTRRQRVTSPAVLSNQPAPTRSRSSPAATAPVAAARPAQERVVADPRAVRPLHIDGKARIGSGSSVPIKAVGVVPGPQK